MMRPALSLSLLLLPALLLVGPRPVSARCAPTGFETYAMNGVDHPLAADGALIVGIRSSRSRRSGPGAGFPELSLQQDGVSIPLRLEALSALVARYVPERAPEPGSYRVEGLGIDVRFEARESGERLRAPAGRALLRRQRSRRRGLRENVRVVFNRPPPAGAVAMLVNSRRGGFGGGVVAAGASEVNVFDWGGRCQRRPSGLRSPPAVGEDVIMRWVDRDGQLGVSRTVQMRGGGN